VDNTSGDITNSDFEQTGTVCHNDILARHFDIREATICSFTYNTAALSREQQGPTSVDAPAAYLCRLSSLHQRAYRYRALYLYLPGPLNVMADILSRKWEWDDSQLLHHFNLNFPQAQPWLLCPLHPDMSSATLSALSMQRCTPEFLAAATLPLRPTNKAGQHFVQNINLPRTFSLQLIQSRGCKSLLMELALAGFLPVATASDLARWQTPYASLRRRTPSWVIATPDGHPAAIQSMSELPDS
jgi:hypothetical protein